MPHCHKYFIKYLLSLCHIHISRYPIMLSSKLVILRLCNHLLLNQNKQACFDLANLLLSLLTFVLSWHRWLKSFIYVVILAFASAGSKYRGMNKLYRPQLPQILFQPESASMFCAFLLIHFAKFSFSCLLCL